MTNMDWDFYPTKNSNNEDIPNGDYAVKMKEISKETSKAGRKMLVCKCQISGYHRVIWFYIVFDNSSPDGIERTNRNLTNLYDSFAVDYSEKDIDAFVGKYGFARLEKDSEGRAKIKYFLSGLKTASIEKFKEPDEDLLDNDCPF